MVQPLILVVCGTGLACYAELGWCCRVLDGVMFQKDVVAPGRMRRKIQNPRILLMDCPIEYKKGENQTNVEITKEEDWYVHSNCLKALCWTWQLAVQCPLCQHRTDVRTVALHCMGSMRARVKQVCCHDIASSACHDLHHHVSERSRHTQSILCIVLQHAPSNHSWCSSICSVHR